MKNITLNGQVKALGRNLPIVLGGFQEGERGLSDNLVAALHEVGVWNIRSAINRNLDHFEEYIDMIDLKKELEEVDTSAEYKEGYALLKQLGYSDMQISKAGNIYLFSRRGYLKLVKIMDDKKSWFIYNKLLDYYFEFEASNLTERGNDFFSMAPKSFAEALRMLADKEEEIEKYKEAEIINAPKMEIGKSFTDESDGSITIDAMLSILNKHGKHMSKVQFYHDLRKAGWLEYEGKINVPTYKAVSEGWLRNKYYYTSGPIYVTPRGQSELLMEYNVYNKSCLARI